MPPALALIGVGSNVGASTHVPAALATLLGRHGVLHVSSVVETAPVGMTDGSGRFWNLALALPVDPGSDMKGMQAALHALERDAGRDRDAPGQSWKARPLDLDLLFVVEDGAVPSDALPREPWIRPLVLELLQHLNIDCPAATDPPALAISFEVAGRALGPGAATLSLDPA